MWRSVKFNYIQIYILRMNFTDFPQFPCQSYFRGMHEAQRCLKFNWNLLFFFSQNGSDKYIIFSRRIHRQLLLILAVP